MKEGAGNMECKLEIRIEEQGKELHVDPRHMEYIQNSLEKLKAHHLPTYEHSIRVGLKAVEIAEFMHLGPRPAFYGVLHDLGKAQIPLEVLAKTKGFDAHDMDVMKNHVQYGYECLLNNRYIFSAWLALQHHLYQKNNYPKELPQKPSIFSERTKLLIDIYSRIIAIADQNDALKMPNDRYGTAEMKAAHAQEIMLASNP